MKRVQKTIPLFAVSIKKNLPIGLYANNDTSSASKDCSSIVGSIISKDNYIPYENLYHVPVKQ